MKKTALFIFSVLFPLMAQTNTGLLPQPKSVTPLKGFFDLKQPFTLSADKIFQNEMQFLADSLYAYPLTLKPEREPADIQLRTFRTMDMASKINGETAPANAESYAIDLQSGKIIISAATTSGMFYGIQTLLNLVRLHPERLPAMKISDAPDFKLRGISDDISRGQVSTMANFKKIIRFLARYKMNVYMPYIEDTYRFKSLPGIGKNRGALSDAEWRELQDYAKNYHVQVIPAFQTLGHYENILYNRARHHLAEFPGAGSLRVNADSTYAFLDRELREVTATFQSPFFNMGADESWDVGKFHTRQLSARHGLATVHARHYKRVYNLLRGYQKKVMMYGDIVLRHPGILAQIPKDIIMMDWHYYPRLNYPSTETFANAGQPFIVSPGIHNWRKLFPNFIDALANMRGMAIDGQQNGAAGFITSNWGDYGGMNLRELGYYGYAYAGAVSWNSGTTHNIDFDRSFFKDFFGDDNPGYAVVYQIFSQIAPHAEWLSMVAHPFYPLEKDGIRAQRLSVELPLAQSRINNILNRLHPRHNRDQIDYLKLCSDFYGWYGRLLALKIDMHRTAHNHAPVPPVLLKQLHGKAIGLALDVKDLSKRYAALWKRTNRPDNLQRMTGLWERVSKELLIKAEEIAKGNLTFNGRLTTPFITLPKTDAKQPVPHLYLRRKFEFKGKPVKAFIQLIANSDADIWLNGQHIGRVWARKSLSAMVEAERVKYWPVEKYIRSGQNIIAVEVKNYTGGKASANVWLEITARDGKHTRITTDAYWKTAAVFFKNWFKKSFDDSAWLNGVETRQKWLISRPYFNRGLGSRIEFYR